MALEPDTCVVGVAIEVPEPWGEDLTAWREGFGDPHADRMPAHITILAPLRIPLSQFATMREPLTIAAATVPAFDVSLGPVGTFRPVSPVVFLHATAAENRLQQLHDCVHTAAGSPPRRHPFHPHVTLAMDVPNPVLDAAEQALAGYAAEWSVTAIAAFLRDERGYWHVQYRVPLASPSFHNV